MYIKGIGMTNFGLQDDSSNKMVYDASLESLEDADMSMNEVDAVVMSTIDLASNGERQRHYASLMSSLFKRDMPIIRVPAGCNGGGAALWTALKIGYNNVLVVGVEKLASNTTRLITDEILMGGERVYEQNEGLTFPAQNALVAQQHMLKYGSNSDDLALVALKNHDNAFLNPKARFYNKKITLEQIKNSQIISSPFRLFDCSLNVNGAAACIVTKDKTDIEIKGSSLMTDYLSPFERDDLISWYASKKSAEEAYKQADISPNDIDVAELHDAFTSVEMISYEDLGFAKKGEGHLLIRDGTTKLDGKLPVNSSGGLKAKGHPISATGVAQIVELVEQLRRKAGDRQVNNPKYGLAQNIGGAGSTVTVHILRKVAG
jgi:acetyl-CoA C-acetyltransferase